MNSGFSRPHTLFVQRNFVADFFSSPAGEWGNVIYRRYHRKALPREREGKWKIEHMSFSLCAADGKAM